MRKYIAALPLLLFCSLVGALDLKPHAEAKISLEQWNAYHSEVERNYGNTRTSHPSHNLETFKIPDKKANIAFTTEGHEAHPSWVTRYVTEKNGSINLSQIGYFAGEEAPFAKLFNQYEQLNKRVREEMARKSGQAE